MRSWLAYALLTILLWGAWGVESKLIVDRTSPWTSQVLFTFGLIPPVGLVLLSPRRFAGRDRRRGVAYAVLTGLLGGSGNIAFFLALVDGKTSVVVPITSLAPLVTVLLAAAVLKERITARQWVGLALALAAIYLLSL